MGFVLKEFNFKLLALKFLYFARRETLHLLSMYFWILQEVWLKGPLQKVQRNPAPVPALPTSFSLQETASGQPVPLILKCSFLPTFVQIK